MKDEVLRDLEQSKFCVCRTLISDRIRRARALLDGSTEGHERPIGPNPRFLIVFAVCHLTHATKEINSFLPAGPMLHLVPGSGAPCQFDSTIKGTTCTFDHSFPSLDSSALSQ